MRQTTFLAFGILLLMAVSIIARHQSLTIKEDSIRGRKSTEANIEARQATKFQCLPDKIKPDDVVSYGGRAGHNVTVEEKLVELKARCRRRKLVDTHAREIRFFRTSCWGNPPADYLQIQQREREELQQLKKRYTVIVLGCDPMIP